MSNDLMINNSKLITNNESGFTAEQVAVIKSQIAKGATDDELKMFISIAQKYKLDPFTKEIWFIKRAKKVKDARGNYNYKRLPNGEIDYTGAETMIFTSRDGYLSIGLRHSEWNGIMSFTVRENDIFEIDAENFNVTHKFGTNRGKIIGAWAKCCRKGHNPQIHFADFSEYFDGNSNTWKKYPSAMIQKVAEVFVLKRQYGISGLVTKEEMYTPDFQVIENEIEYLKAPNEMVEDIKDLIKKYSISENDIKRVLGSVYGKDDINRLTEKEAENLILRLNSKFESYYNNLIEEVKVIVNENEESNINFNNTNIEELQNIIGDMKMSISEAS